MIDVNFGRVVIYGAGASGVLIKNIIESNCAGDIVLFIDDNGALVGKTLLGCKIHSPSILTNTFIEQEEISSIVVSNMRIHLSKIDFLESLGLKIYLPKDLQHWQNGNLAIKDIIDVDSGFLINRKVVKNLNNEFLEVFTGKQVLVTGAAGSIGSELVRQLSCAEEVALVLVDINESDLHDLILSLGSRRNIKYYVTDISHLSEFEYVFKCHGSFDYVFHAAAYKHVPIVEINPYPAIRVNIIGTLNVCKLVEKYRAGVCTLVSTDKAVNPTNIMGATKRIAELVISYYDNKCVYSSFRSTRFGNVLGSRGSAIPLFIDQIKKGGPITLTSNEMTRYFMTIPEAAQLVIKSANLQNDGGTYLFDMGESLKLIDIISNLTAYYEVEDIDIKITGLRPGEKLFEELSKTDETIDSTEIEKIGKIKTKVTPKRIMAEINAFTENYTELNVEQVRKALNSIIPEYGK